MATWTDDGYEAPAGSNSSHTHSAKAIGTAASDRLVIVMITLVNWEADDITGVTIGGVTASEMAAPASDPGGSGG